MFADAIEQVQRAIFPIFFRRKIWNQTQLGVSGTGFFIDSKGHFATACHVIDDIPTDATIFTVGNVPYSTGQQEEIVEVARNTETDVFIGRAEQNAQQPLSLSDTRVRVGSSVCISGYPLASMTATAHGINVQNVRQYHQQSMVLDFWKMQLPYAGPRGQFKRSYECFWITNSSLPGMSGGPAFGTDGIVYGVDVATGTRVIPASGKRQEIQVSSGVAVHIQYVVDLLAKST